MKTLSVFLLSGMILFLAHTGVAACNLSPIATIETNMTDDIFFHDEAGSFSGTNSYPYCGSINEYRWRVRPLDGTFTTVSSNSVYFHTFTLENNVDENQYQVELRVRNSAGKYGYAYKTITVKRHYTRLYYLTDHLGSVRVTVNDEGDPVGWDDYYPFGLQMPGRTQNQSNPNDDQKFTGYELEQQGDLGLYHAGARMYDPVIGRFNSQDRFKEKYPSMSPYQYAALNPILFIDVNGDSLFIRGSDEAVNQFLNVVNEGLGGFHNASVNENGLVALQSTGKEGAMSDSQQAFFDVISEAASLETGASSFDIINHGDELSTNIFFGDNGRSAISATPGVHTIDIGDASALGQDGVLTAQGVVAHEIKEGFAIQVQEISENRAHSLGFRAEGRTTGVVIISPGASINSKRNQITVPVMIGSEQRNIRIKLRNGNVRSVRNNN